MSKHTVLIHFDEARWAQASTLAAANYPDKRNPSGGNVKALLQYLVTAAYNDPERFGLAAPGESPDARPSVSQELADK